MLLVSRTWRPVVAAHRKCSSFEVWREKPDVHKDLLEKHIQFYHKLGYPTLTCILPERYLFNYDWGKIKEYSEQLKEAVLAHKVDSVVFHCMSNNGSFLYQETSQKLHHTNRVKILGFMQNVRLLHCMFLPRSWYFLPDVEKWNIKRSNPIIFVIHLSRIMLANKEPLPNILRQIYYQIQKLRVNWPKYKHIPWVGVYMRDHEKFTWPLLFVYSVEDMLMPYKFVETVARAQQSEGRLVHSYRFDKSGHVAHLKVYPDVYQEVVTKFLQTLE